MKRIVLVRHGVTPCTMSGLYCGRHDPELTADALRAVGLAASHPALRDCDRVVTSPSKRAVATAAAIAVNGLPAPRVDERLLELDFGAWDGLAADEVRARPEYSSWEADPARFAPPGGESGREAQTRLVNAVDEHLRASDKLVIVSHKGAIRLIVSHYCGLAARDYRRLPPIPAASVSLVELGPEGGRAVLLGDISHLTSDLVLGAY